DGPDHVEQRLLGAEPVVEGGEEDIGGGVLVAGARVRDKSGDGDAPPRDTGRPWMMRSKLLSPIPSGRLCASVTCI
ncbi:hypothetical protein, partial [Streptomyces albidoflavus]|uniref:hypothetical protein n=1 Tax=Streptomyces albidoflavus TaxID=1886 RepID=UPI00340AC6F1